MTDKLRSKACGSLGALVLLILTVSVVFAAAPPKVRITDMDDFVFGVWSGVGGLSSTDQVCVFVRGGDPYRVQATGTGSGGSFALSNGVGNLPYQVYFDDVSGGTNAVQLTNTIWSGGQTGSSGQQFCQGGSYAALTVELLQPDLAAAATGNYAGTLTVTVQAE